MEAQQKDFQLSQKDIDYTHFKSLLEYFVAYLEYYTLNNINTQGYQKYIKPVIEKYGKLSGGVGYKKDGGLIQAPIRKWEKYGDARICLNNTKNFGHTVCYLNWVIGKHSTAVNIYAKWERTTKITQLKIVFVDVIWDNNIEKIRKTGEKTIKILTCDELGLFEETTPNHALQEFYNTYLQQLIMEMQKNKMTYNMQTDFDNLDPLQTLLKNNGNLVLTGAPGTGKTYTAKQLAIQMCAGDLYKIDEEWERLLKEGRVGFVQFHPSYDYTDFVEGLRPVKSNTEGEIGFERKDGIFKAFCKGALKNNAVGGVDDFERCWQLLINDIDANDYVQIPLLSGKKDIVIELNEYGTGLCNRTYENGIYEKGKWISGASKFFSKEQLYNIYKGLPGVPQGGHDNYRKAIVQYMEQQYNMQKYILGDAIDNKQSYVFIIDEINRGELSKIFGELFFSIDPGYRGKQGSIKTQYQNLVEETDEFCDGFYILENVYIIGTMNDIDRGVESMDFAIRRRFAWKEVKAKDSECIIDSADNVSTAIKDEAKNRMRNLNNAIRDIDSLGEAFCLGGAYFKKIEQYDGDFEQLWKNHIEGLLKEYLRGTTNVEQQMEGLKKAYDNTIAPA